MVVNGVAVDSKRAIVVVSALGVVLNAIPPLFLWLMLWQYGK
jgi:hypothetical protein